ncbi:hypothetical protein OGAPHI_004201 [Ogataea philodendri]|uniref:Prolyl 4-hydroxylase alpha subunit domain-containing protein n=1 Tax=Ogataea philodendri TaxID=1378263 RepID=A0A9P8P732_9ASCO|nr:uncharacterized protein OGAPHI_004201 [Ogataea philodendri]KAH3666012.1 hypothetical protein OGAPHI_004201 [Ogataea philodendri]
MGPKKQTQQSGKSGQKFQFPPSVAGLDSAKANLYKPQFESVVPGQIFTVSKFLTADQCRDLIAAITQGLPLETTPLVKSKFYAARVNDRASISDVQGADLFYQYFRQLLEFQSQQEMVDGWIVDEMTRSEAFNPNLRFYRYTKGQYFGKHYDESVGCGQGRATKWTVLIYLSDQGLKGGETIFYNDAAKGPDKQIATRPVQGMALFHKHGDDCLLHEAAAVAAGEKWVFRTDVVYDIYK